MFEDGGKPGEPGAQGGAEKAAEPCIFGRRALFAGTAALAGAAAFAAAGAAVGLPDAAEQAFAGTEASRALESMGAEEAPTGEEDEPLAIDANVEIASAGADEDTVSDTRCQLDNGEQGADGAEEPEVLSLEVADDDEAVAQVAEIVGWRDVEGADAEWLAQQEEYEASAIAESEAAATWAI